MTTSLKLDSVTECRIQRKVYDRWNSIDIQAITADGLSVYFNLEGLGYSLDHKPIPVTWEAPEHERPEGQQAHRQPRELFNIKNCNQPEPLQLTAIRELLMSYDEENETPNEILHAIHEVLFGPRADSVAFSQEVPSISEPVSVEDDEIPF